jgi:hypothetical protein
VEPGQWFQDPSSLGSSPPIVLFFLPENFEPCTLVEDNYGGPCANERQFVWRKPPLRRDIDWKGSGFIKDTIYLGKIIKDF